MRVVQVGEVGWRMAAVGSGGVADAASVFGGLVAWGIAEALGAAAATDGRGQDGGSEGSVDEVGDAAARAAILVAGVGRRGGGDQRERRAREQGRGGAGGSRHLALQHSLTALA